MLGPVHLLGVDERRFPADFPAFARYGPALRRDRRHWPLPDEHLPLSVLDDVERALGVTAAGKQEVWTLTRRLRTRDDLEPIDEREGVPGRPKSSGETASAAGRRSGLTTTD
jgi:hypothetical protein